MIPIGTLTLLGVFVLFCRIGTCLMLMPGFSSARVPTRIRLFMALALTLVMTPPLVGGIEATLSGLTPAGLAGLVASEILVGAMIGTLARLFFLALETMAHAATMAIGFSALPGSPVEENEPQPALVSLITFSALVLLFVTNQHWEVIRALFVSYESMPVADGFGAQVALNRIVAALGDAFIVALRITSPFIVYAVIVNFAVGLTNKLTPQIPVYFIALPFILFGGLLLLWLVAPELLHLFIDGFAAWLARA